MEIIQLNLKHFGMFHDYRLDLHAGINIISGGNETGKSTLHAFIRAMLYGITRNRSRSLDEYQLREPWENPSAFAGSMKLLYDGKIYRIDRNFHRREERVEVVCETDGTRAEDPEGTIRVFTGGMSETDFDNTVYIRQGVPQAGGALSQSLRDSLINQERRAEDTVDVTAAQEYLKKKKKSIENERQGALSSIEEEIGRNAQEAEYVKKDLERLLEARSRAGAQSDRDTSFERVAGVQTEDPERLSEQDRTEQPRTPGQETGAGQTPKRETGSGQTQDEDSRQADENGLQDGMPQEKEDTAGVLLPVTVFLSFAAAGLMLACAFLASDIRLRCLTGAGAVLCGAVACSLLWRVLHPISKSERVMRRMKREAFLDRHLGFREDPEDPEDLARARERERRARDQILRAREEEACAERLRQEKKQEQLQQAAERMQKEDAARRGKEVERIARSKVLEREITLRRQKLDELRVQQEALYRKKAALSSYDEEIRAVALAQERIRELAGSIYHESGAEFAGEVSAILSMLTDGRYSRISLDERMLVQLNTPDRLLTLEQVSCSTMQQVYFALRLASAGLLSGGADLPLILDEPFVMYDDERLERALRLLSGSAWQVILFTSQRRELDILSQLRRARRPS